ncbi:Crp/Fnr family transcriptional regulator [Tenacibaculum amylolyticum]|uniref:Crp/Fnr family transcriptional regulator n=1 Tax=Tenacibaculum amylolyticum TaxID=104269 RepID=UPI00389369D9
MKTDFLSQCYPDFSKELLYEIEKYALQKVFKANEYIVKQGDFIKYLPILRKGCIKVFCSEDTIDFLLYFIEPGESCIYSFAHINNEKQAEFSAIAELESELLLLPIDRVKLWIKKFPSLNAIVLNNYKKHYSDLLSTTKQIICYNLEDRLIEYLNTKSKIESSSTLQISHQDIANNLGTSREVISRLMQKLNAKQIVKQDGRRIKIL